MSDNIRRNSQGRGKIYVSGGRGCARVGIERNDQQAFQLERKMLVEQILRKDDELLQQRQKIAELGDEGLSKDDQLSKQSFDEADLQETLPMIMPDSKIRRTALNLISNTS